MARQEHNGDEPATQHDLAVWGGRLTERIDELAEQMATKEELALLKQLQEKTLSIQEATFASIQSIEGRLKEMADHEVRIQRLEDAAFSPKSRR